MSQLGLADEWLEATARSEAAPAVRFSSFFPFQGDTLLVVPPRSMWPPPEATKIRCKGARFVPLSVVESLLAGKAIDENRWAVDGESECLVPHDHGARAVPRRAAIERRRGPAGMLASRDRTPQRASNSRADAGLWTVVQFADEAAAAAKWEAPVRSALLLLADSGFGGERSRGWGRSEAPRVAALDAARSIPSPRKIPPNTAHWLLSLYTSVGRRSGGLEARKLLHAVSGAAASKAARAGAN